MFIRKLGNIIHGDILAVAAPARGTLSDGLNITMAFYSPSLMHSMAIYNKIHQNRDKTKWESLRPSDSHSALPELKPAWSQAFLADTIIFFLIKSVFLSSNAVASFHTFPKAYVFCIKRDSSAVGFSLIVILWKGG